VYLRPSTKLTMKFTLLLSGLTLLLFSCNLTTDADFKNLAKDTCGCMSLVTDDLSDEMKQIMIDADGSEAAYEEAFNQYISDDPLAALGDIEVLERAESNEVLTCMSKLEKKYENEYTFLSEDEMADKIISELQKLDGCDITTAFLKMGMNDM
jgi:hypothetical protein